MHQRGPESVRDQNGETFFEECDLSPRLLGIADRCEMRAYAFQLQVAAGCDGCAHARQSFSRGAQARHPSVDLEMNRQHGLLLRRRTFEAFDMPLLPYDRSQMIGNDLVFFAFPDAGHQQKTSLDAGAAKRHRLFGTRHSKPGSVFGLERSRASGGTVAVGVRLDHGADADAFADMLPHGAEVLA